MKIIKKVLANLKMVYTVNTITINNKIHLLAATEDKGKCLIFSPPNWECNTIWENPGGTMNIIPNHKNDSIVSIQGFFPIFDSKDAHISISSLIDINSQSWHTREIAGLPYVHRIDLLENDNDLFLIAATLCGNKKFIEDWTSPGAVFASRLDVNTSTLKLDMILNGLTKNHGMHITELNNKKAILISSELGVHAIYPTNNEIVKWEKELIISNPISDIYTVDIDCDGIKEIIAIEPFHGDVFSIYKLINNTWNKIFEKSMSFGHVVWGGEIGSETCIILGNRSGAKELELLTINSKDVNFSFNSTIIDSNIGPTQIKVFNHNGKSFLLSANHYSGEVALYEFTEGEQLR